MCTLPCGLNTLHPCYSPMVGLMGAKFRIRVQIQYMQFFIFSSKLTLSALISPHFANVAVIRAGGRKGRQNKGRQKKGQGTNSIPSQYATLFSRVSPIFDQLKCFSYHYEPFPTIKHFRKQDIVKIENLATRQMWRDLGPAE